MRNRTTYSWVFRTMQTVREVLADLHLKATRKEKVGNEKEAICIMEKADRLDLMANAVRNFYFPKPGSVFTVDYIYNDNGNSEDFYKLVLRGINNSDFSNIKTGEPLIIRTNGTYTNSTEAYPETHFLDYYTTILKVNPDNYYIGDLSYEQSCPDQIDGPYDVAGLYLVLSDNTEIEITTSSVSTIDGTTALGIPDNLNMTTFRNNLESFLEADGNFTVYRNGNYIQIGSNTYNLSGAKFRTYYYVDCNNDFEFEPYYIDISLDLANIEVTINAQNGTDSNPEIAQASYIDYVWIPYACGSEDEFQRIYQEVQRIKNENC